MEGETPPPDALLHILGAVDSLLGEVDDDRDPERAEALAQIRVALLDRLRDHARDWAEVEPPGDGAP
jgi:hypothetical protein